MYLVTNIDKTIGSRNYFYNIFKKLTIIFDKLRQENQSKKYQGDNRSNSDIDVVYIAAFANTRVIAYFLLAFTLF